MGFGCCMWSSWGVVVGMRVLAIEVCVSFEGNVGGDTMCGLRNEYVVPLAADMGESSAILARYVQGTGLLW